MSQKAAPILRIISLRALCNNMASLNALLTSISLTYNPPPLQYMLFVPTSKKKKLLKVAFVQLSPIGC